MNNSVIKFTPSDLLKNNNRINELINTTKRKDDKLFSKQTNELKDFGQKYYIKEHSVTKMNEFTMNNKPINVV